MPLTDELVRSGNWLYGRRSYLPLIMLGMLIAGMMDFTYPGNSASLESLWEVTCLVVSFCGLGIRIYAIGHAPSGTSGRSTAKQEAHSLSTTGLYSVVRHPLYLGNFLIWLGISMFFRDWRLIVISTLTFWVYYERIMAAEEQFLRERFGDEFERWASSTPAFLPTVKGWKSPAYSFSLRSVLRREYGGFIAIILIFGALHAAAHFFVEGELYVDKLWGGLIILGLLIYGTLHTLKKKSKLLDTPTTNDTSNHGNRSSDGD